MKIAEKIKESEPLEGLKLLSVRTPVEDAVTVSGSFPGGRFYDTDGLTPYFTAKLLDWGTKKRSKDEIREKLESSGASLNFLVDSRRVRFKIKCLKENLAEVVSILAEEIREPLLRKQSLETEKKILIADIKADEEDPEEVSRRVLYGEMFPKGHPFYLKPFGEILKEAEAAEISDLKNFHRAAYGLGEIVVSAAGDINDSELEKIFRKEFAGFKKSPLELLPPVEKKKEIRGIIEKNIFIPDKTSVSLKIGQALGIGSGHPDFYPLVLGVEILGGHGFSSRLMEKIREEKGLSYGVYAGLSGGARPDNACFSVSATFAPELAMIGKKAVAAEIEKWIKNGVTETELSLAKKIVLGSFRLGFETTGGIAGTVIGNSENGRNAEYLDRYPKMIELISKKEVNQAIKKHISAENLIFVLAGTLKK